MKYFFDYAKEIDNYILHPSMESFKSINEIITNNGVEFYFWRNVSTAKSIIDWFEVLAKNDILVINYDEKERNKSTWKLNFLDNVSIRISELKKENIQSELLKIINNIIDYINQEKHYFHYDSWVIIKILFRFKLENIVPLHINFIKKVLTNSAEQFSLIANEIKKNILPTILKNENKEFLLLFTDHVLLGYKVKDESYRVKGIVSSYYLKEIMSNHGIDMVKLAGKDIIQIGINKIEKIVSDDQYKFSLITIPTIENSNQRWNLNYFEDTILDFIRDGLSIESMKNDREHFIKDLILRSHPIFIRLGIHFIDEYYSDYSKYFWDQYEEFLNNSDLHHEVYMLLKNNCQKFTSDQIETILRFIQKNTFTTNFRDDITDEEKVKYNFSKKYRWINSLSSLKDERIEKLRNEYSEKASLKNEFPHPEHLIYHSRTTADVRDKSPISTESLSELPIHELIEYLKNYKEEDGFDHSNRAGLSNTLFEVTKNNSSKYLPHINQFLSLDIIFQNSIIKFLINLFSKKEIGFNIFNNYLINLIESKIWNQDNPPYDYSKGWLIDTISNFVEEFTKEDTNAPKEEDLKILINSLQKIIENAPAEITELEGLIGKVLNSIRGKIYTMLVVINLQIGRKYKKNEEMKWNEDSKNFFDKNIRDQSKNNLEVYFILGQFLPQFTFLDRKWVKENVNSIFIKEKELKWESAMTGFFYYSSTVYKDLYDLLKENKHFEKAISHPFKDENVEEKLVQFVGLGYSKGWEKLDDSSSLINLLLVEKSYKKYLNLVMYYWIERDNFKKKLDSSKITPLWEKIYNNIIEEENNVDVRKVFSNLINWLYFIDEINNENMIWLKTSAKYIGEDHNLGNLIDIAKGKVQKYPDQIGELMILALNSQPVDYYDEGDTKQIVYVLYELNTGNSVKFANEISNWFGERGFYFLRDYYEEYKKVYPSPNSL